MFHRRWRRHDGGEGEGGDGVGDVVILEGSVGSINI